MHFLSTDITKTYHKSKKYLHHVQKSGVAVSKQLFFMLEAQSMSSRALKNKQNVFQN